MIKNLSTRALGQLVHELPRPLPLYSGGPAASTTSARQSMVNRDQAVVGLYHAGETPHTK